MTGAVSIRCGAFEMSRKEEDEQSPLISRTELPLLGASGASKQAWIAFIAVCGNSISV